jgi:hypothetical protein
MAMQYLALCRTSWQADVTHMPTFTTRRFNWDSVPKQLESVKGLLQHDFLHIFPGHGRQFHFDSLDDRTQRVHELLTEEGA